MSIVLLDSLKDEYAYQVKFKAKETVDLKQLILFLDFDGVLHPFGCSANKMFCEVPRIEKILEKYPFVDVVFSTSWSASHSLDELRSHFKKELKERFVGKVEDNADRGFACRQWLTRHGLEECPWIALDDIAVFSENDPVMRTSMDTGLTEVSIGVLEEAIKSPLEFQRFVKENEELKICKQNDGYLGNYRKEVNEKPRLRF